MKVLKFIFISLLAIILLACVGLFVFVKTFDINRHKSRIESEISTSIGRQVTFDRIDWSFSLNKGFFLKVTDISIKGSLQAASKDLLSIAQAQIQVDVMTYLKEQEIRISQISVRRPRIHIIKDQRGVLNTEPVPPQSLPDPTPDSSAPGITPEEETQLEIPPIFVETINIDDGEIVYQDQSSSFPMDIEILKLKIYLTRFSLSEPFPFKIRFALWSDADNVLLDGQVSLDFSQQKVSVRDCHINFDLSRLKMENIIKAFPSLRSVPLGSGYKGQCQLGLKQLTVGAKGLETLLLTGNIKEGQAGLPYRELVLDHMQLQFELDPRDLNLKHVSAEVGQGRVSAEGVISDYMNTQGYSFQFKTEGVSLADLLPEIHPEVQVLGNIQGEFALAGEGFQYPALLSQLHGQGNVAVDEGRLEDFNILKVLFGRINILPNVSLLQALSSGLPEKYQDVLNRKDTILTDAGVSVAVEPGGTVRLTPVKLVTDYLTFSGEGEMDLENNMSFSSEVFLSPDLSASIIDRVEEMQALLDQDNRIRIPLKPFNGQVQDFRMYPEVGTLVKNVLIQKGKSEFEKFLHKVIEANTDEAPDDEPGSPQEETSPAEDDNPLEKPIIDLLETIFQD